MFAEILQVRPANPGAALRQLRNSTAIGFEVTSPELGAACAANFDPQHTGGRTDTSAIEAVLAMLTGQATAATVLPDLDSLGSMAVLSIAMELIAAARAFEGGILRRIELIGKADRFECGEWPGVRPLPSLHNPWFENTSAGEIRELAAMAAVVKDYKLPLEERVLLLKRWLLTGKEPDAYRLQVEREREEMLHALAAGKVRARSRYQGRVAQITSTFMAGLGLGYCLAPVVVARNPQHTVGGSKPHIKYTIAQFREGYIDMKALLAELNKAERLKRGLSWEEYTNRWGGSPTICGSPQGDASVLTHEAVVRLAKKHLL